MAIQAKFILIFGDAIHNKFMQCCDVFSPDKVLGELEEITITFDEKETKVTYTACQRIIDKMTKEFPKEFILSLIHLHSIIEDDKVLLNTKGKCKPYINKSVRQISNGQVWTMFHKILEQFEIKFELDEYCFIK